MSVFTNVLGLLKLGTGAARIGRGASTVADDLTAAEQAITDEATARSNADGTLQDNINAEALARSNADGTLQDNIDAEALARSNADGVLQDSIDAEALARSTADGTLQENITAEALARSTADTTLQENIDAIPAPGSVLIDTASITSSVSAVVFTGLDSAYDVHELIFSGLEASANSQLSLQYSTDNGATWIQANYGYSSITIGSSTTIGSSYAGSTTSFVLTDPMNMFQLGPSGRCTMHNLAAAEEKSINFETSYQVASMSYGAGTFSQSVAVNAIKIFMGAGSLVGGAISLYGVKK